MKVSYVEGLANRNGPESCGAAREGGAEALTGGRTGRVLSREIDALSRKRQVLRDADEVENDGRRQSGFWQNCASDSRGSASSCMPTRRESSSLAAMRNRIGEIGAMANRERSTSWVLRTAAGKLGRGTSRYCARRCARGGKLSCGL
jgi:hypothetical protein